MKLDINQKFINLVEDKTIDEQCEFFIKSFIFSLGDNYKEVIELSEQFKKYLSSRNESKDLNCVQASDFLQKNGLTRTGIERKQEVADIDLDHNGRICFVEYLLLHYKIMILKDYYKRTGDQINIDLNSNGIGLTGVGNMLLDELFFIPVGLDPKLEQAIEEFFAEKREKEQIIKKLKEQTKLNGVAGLKAVHELKQIQVRDNTETNRLEITLNAAKRRGSGKSAEAELFEKKELERKESERKLLESRNALKKRASVFEKPEFLQQEQKTAE